MACTLLSNFTHNFSELKHSPEYLTRYFCEFICLIFSYFHVLLLNNYNRQRMYLYFARKNKINRVQLYIKSKHISASKYQFSSQSNYLYFLASYAVFYYKNKRRKLRRLNIPPPPIAIVVCKWLTSCRVQPSIISRKTNL